MGSCASRPNSAYFFGYWGTTTTAERGSPNKEAQRTCSMVTNTEHSKTYVAHLANSVVTTRVRGGVPTNFSFNSNTGKLLFLAANPTSSLQYVDVNDKDPTTSVEQLHPQVSSHSLAHLVSLASLSSHLLYDHSTPITSLSC